MPSPFPGMDPYLESPNEWGGVHHALIVALAAQLNRLLPPGLRAKLDQYIRVEEAKGGKPRTRSRNPDVFVSGEAPPHPPLHGTKVALLGSPTLETVLLQGKLTRHRRILIETLDGHEVVTALEILSPSNKRAGSDRRAYLSKRNEYLAAGTNLVEIDLLRAGRRMPAGNPPPPETDYLILVSAAERRPVASVWAFSIRQTIPLIGVPLSEGREAVALDIRAGLDRVYDEGRYASALDYAHPPAPPLDPIHAAWVTGLLKPFSTKPDTPR